MAKNISFISMLRVVVRLHSKGIVCAFLLISVSTMVCISCSRHLSPPAISTSPVTQVPTAAISGTVSAAASHTFTNTDTPVVFYTNTETSTFTMTDTFTPTRTATNTKTPIPTLSSAQIIATQTVVAEMVAVPGGTFTQADSYGNYSFVHTISPFKIAKYELTYDLWYKVYDWSRQSGNYVYASNYSVSEGFIGTTKQPTNARFQPAYGMSWYDAIIWCNAYSELAGLTPVYYKDPAFLIPHNVSKIIYPPDIDPTPGSIDYPYVKWDANGYRLPTYGEWQYAARYIDGTSWLPTNYASGAADFEYNSYATMAVAWCVENSDYYTHIVGLLIPNALGIYDMSGNVSEWCWDWGNTYFPNTPKVNYRGPDVCSLINPGRIIAGSYFTISSFDSGVHYLSWSDLFYGNMGGAVTIRLVRSN
ncbi:MAG: hypothetical protein CVV21_02445 [Candidatus Goldiibacteriota bacterium HGW-Goldbacteria-1]|jgi:formylglycine-generating enzyme required for sulfatase activity|nr:MAG: hypothetical protein CVV21_02445 [Candidatus Goldiibacteriota bacterium HGW-Goldbacteria-1]